MYRCFAGGCFHSAGADGDPINARSLFEQSLQDGTDLHPSACHKLIEMRGGIIEDEHQGRSNCYNRTHHSGRQQQHKNTKTRTRTTRRSSLALVTVQQLGVCCPACTTTFLARGSRVLLIYLGFRALKTLRSRVSLIVARPYPTTRHRITSSFKARSLEKFGYEMLYCTQFDLIKAPLRSAKAWQHHSAGALSQLQLASARPKRNPLELLGFGVTVRALIIRIGFWGFLAIAIVLYTPYLQTLFQIVRPLQFPFVDAYA